ncbi:MAG: short-chain dehydrogenase [Chloroflexi bacterium]|nr:short-chain dehydrogenase [Chloroflexota bacterium]|tara:strand:+ start:11019 stop:11771 length:753 start_codon:yes stop_codon:yes gene_type:complete
MTSQKRLDGKTALITGANSGIGASCVKLFSAQGANIIATDTDRMNFNDEIIQIQSDVTKSDEAKKLINDILIRFKSIDIVVNSAGVTSRNAIPDTNNDEEIWDRVMEVNVKGIFIISKYVIEVMKTQKQGSIINLASIMGVVGYPETLGTPLNPYPPSKGAVIQLTKTLANHVAQYGIRVNAICPGFIETNMTKSLTENQSTKKIIEELHPMGRMGKAEEVANAALFLASDESSFITGSNLLVDGGYTAK